MVFYLFLLCPWLNCADHSGMVWKISSLWTSYAQSTSCPRLLKWMMSQAVEGHESTWVITGGSGVNIWVQNICDTMKDTEHLSWGAQKLIVSSLPPFHLGSLPEGNLIWGTLHLKCITFSAFCAKIKGKRPLTHMRTVT